MRSAEEVLTHSDQLSLHPGCRRDIQPNALMLSQHLKMTFCPSNVTGRRVMEGKAYLLKAQSSWWLQLWQDMTKHDIIYRKNEVCLPLHGSMGGLVSVFCTYSLGGLRSSGLVSKNTLTSSHWEM